MAQSLYIHIPFCLKRCAYCDFVSGIFDPLKADEYINALKKEISALPRETEFSTLFIGGGTPTTLSAHTLKDLIYYMFSHLTFNGSYEATIETNPGTVDFEKLHALRLAGINRISIGIQSFHDDELAFLGRIHTAEEAEHAVSLAHDAGFENIGIDLIYGIPGQNIVSWRKTLENAVRLKPTHISAYELTVEKGTMLYEYLKNPPLSPFSKGGFIESPLSRGNIGVCSPLWQRGVRGDFAMKNISKADNLKLLDEEKIIEMYEYTIDYLTSKNYIHYEISNFALPDYFCKHNLNYWDRGEYYGAGLGAHSFIDHKRFYNFGDLEFYINALTENKSPVQKIEQITNDKAIAETFFLGLRKTGGINLKTVSESYKQDLVSMYQNEIKELEEAGLVEYNSKSFNLRLTRKGLLLSNEVFTKFI
ncbi:MAG: radical SAM family heme chaperone HemW [Nitrospirae bacterium]|nr:radical SAM family heme chaperone HemW [Nitrospirota bacterium]